MTQLFGNPNLEVPRPGDEPGLNDFLRKLLLRLRELDWLNGGRNFIVDQDGEQVFMPDGTPLVG